MTAKPDYVMGHTDRERRRLALQAAILNPLTDSLLRRAGVSAGMSILELGCGIGDVSLIAARLIGPHVELATTTSRIRRWVNLPKSGLCRRYAGSLPDSA